LIGDSAALLDHPKRLRALDRQQGVELDEQGVDAVIVPRPGRFDAIGGGL
jgi:hypothetical protein